MPVQADAYDLKRQPIQRVRILNKHTTSPVRDYTRQSRYMSPPSHRYNNQRQPKSNLSIQKTNSHQTNIHLQICNTGINPATGAAMEYHDLTKNQTTKIVWARIMANEFGRLAKGFGTITKTGTENIEFIKKSQVPFSDT